MEQSLVEHAPEKGINTAMSENFLSVIAGRGFDTQ
jgi:hypothetical protein